MRSRSSGLSPDHRRRTSPIGQCLGTCASPHPLMTVSHRTSSCGNNHYSRLGTTDSTNPLAWQSSAMPLIRPSHLSAARAVRFTPSTTIQIRRPLSTSHIFRSAEGSHEEHYDPPGGWLWGIRPGEKYEKEGWENAMYYGFFGCIAFGLIGYCYKPDTRSVPELSPQSRNAIRMVIRRLDAMTDSISSIQTWALEEARRRLEAEGILQDPGLKAGDNRAQTTE